jgi:TonB-linked SusC/RagA family outer membrane protein
MKKSYTESQHLYSSARRWALFSLLIFFLLPAFVMAKIQETVSEKATITGLVKDFRTGKSLPGITITEKGTTNRSVSDENGIYKINAAENSTLIFSGLGYVSKEVVVARVRVINVSLQEDTQNLEEFVVVGYGKQKNSRITGAIAKITNQDLDERPTSRIDHAMAGKLSGVQVQEVSGSPGKGLAVKVRGISSISNSSAPLYVVDGYPISSGLDNINPNDIESIEVLKDASSAAIYGSRGSSGVVLVTTKSGKAGKPQLQFDSYLGIADRFSKVDVLDRDEYLSFAIEERNNTWALQGGKVSDPNNVRSNANYWIDPKWLTDPTSFPNNDWQKLISRNAIIQNHQLSASGSNETVKYFVSGNFFDQEGIILGSDYKRMSFRTNVETKIGNRVNLGLNLSANSVIKNDSDGDGNGGPVSRSARVAPIIGLNQQTQDGGYYPYHAAFYLNPIALATEISNNIKSKNILANIYSTIDLAENLRFRTSFGTDIVNDFNQYYKPNNVNRGVGSLGNVGANSLENYLSENILTYNIERNKLSVNALAGFTYQQEEFFTSGLEKRGFPDDEIRTLNAGTTLFSGQSNGTEWSLMSFLSRVSTSWDEKYLFTASIRRDGSSRFGSNNRWGWFPAASIGWRVGQEDFMKEIDFISELKLRASYGAAGNNNIGNYSAIGSLAASNYVLGGSQIVNPGFSPGSFSNIDLGWEKTYTFDIGFDISVFNNRIGASFDYYRADVNDLLLNVPVPAISGFSNALVNIGSIRNKGVELELNTVNLAGKFKWNTSFNISHNENKVTALGRDGSPIFGSVSGYPVTITTIGSPIGSYYMFEQAGVFVDQKDLDSNPKYRVQNVGDIKYRDINGDGVINNSDKKIVGNNNPKYFWGLQNSFSYQNFDFTVSMDGQWGNKLLNIAANQTGQSRGNVDGYWRERWQSPSNPGNGWVPRAAVTANLTTPSTFWLRSADYWRIRTAALGYRVPSKLFSKTNAISDLRIYTSIDNVFMHDHYNKNPQTGTFSNTNTVPGVDFDATYPLARTFTLGLNLKF